MNNWRLERVDPQWVKLEAPGVAIIKEGNGDQPCVLRLEVPEPFVVLRHLDDQPPLKWVKNKKCADAALFVRRGGSNCLHVIELKSKITLAEWKKAKLQFEGMIFNAKSLLSVVDGESIDEFFCHISFSKDAINISETDDPVLLKTALGGDEGLGGFEDWSSGKVRLNGFPDMVLVKWARDPQTNMANGSI